MRSYGDLGGCYPDEVSVIKAAIFYLSFVPLSHLWPNLAKKLIIKSVSVGKLKKTPNLSDVAFFHQPFMFCC